MPAPDSIGNLLWTLLRAALSIYVLLLLVMTGCQRWFIYHPQRASEAELLATASRSGFEPWRDPEGTLHGWRTASSGVARAPGKAIVVFPGNAGHALHRDHYAHGFASLLASGEWQLHILEYPGYGARPGRPSEKTIKAAAGAAFGNLIEAGLRVFLVGESLGSGVACWLAGRHPERVAGLLLVAPFTSLVDVGKHHYPLVPVGLLLRERYDNVAALAAFRGPAVFLLAGRDEVVPNALGRRLHQSYSGPGLLLVEPDRSHNTLMSDARTDRWDGVAEFWDSAALQQH